MPAVSPLDLSGLLLIAEQILVGAVLGFSLQLFFQAFAVAGQIVAIQMGMGFASMIDPTNGVSVAVIGQFFTMLVTLIVAGPWIVQTFMEYIIQLYKNIPMVIG